EYAEVAKRQLVLKQNPKIRARKILAHSPRDIILAACHGYVGWARLKRRATAGGLAALKHAMELYPHGLPMLRLYFDTLLRLSAEAGKPTPAPPPALPGGLLSAATINPSTLLTP